MVRKVLPLVPWFLLLLALAFSPDAKLHRLKLTHLEWCLLAAAVLWAWEGLKDGWVLRRTALDLPVAALALAALGFHLLAPERSISGPELHRVWLGCGAFFIASQSLASEKARPFWALGWCLLAAGLGAFALYGRLSGDAGRAMASFGNPIFFASFLAPAIPMTLSIIACDPKRPVFPWLLLALQVGGLAATGTRASILALAAALAVALLIHVRDRRFRIAGAAALAGAAAAALLLFSRPITHGLIWQSTLRLWLDHPILGAGLGRFHLEFPAYAGDALRALWPQAQVVVNHAHSEWMQTLSETGLIGAGIFSWCLAAFARTRPTLSEVEASNQAPRAAFYWAAAALWLQSFLSPDMRFGVTWASAFTLTALAVPAVELVHWHAGAAARALVIGTVTLFSGWAAVAAAGGALASRALDEPSFFSNAPELDAELARRRHDAEARPDDPKAWEELAYLYAKREDFAAAIPAFERAAALDPRLSGPLNNLANIHYLQGRHAEAVRAWEQALRRDPRLVDAHVNLAIVLYSQGRLKEAAAHLEQALKIDPANAKARAILRRMTE